ncbi:MAG TPA: hypothetical protein VF228_01610, partial [Iamia sp.]
EVGDDRADGVGLLESADGRPGLPLGPDGTTPAPEPARGRLRRFWFVPAGVALLGAAALVPSVGSSGPGAGEARVLVDGVAVVTEAGGGTTTIRDDRVDVGPGDQVEVIEGRAVFEMAGDVRLEGRGRHDDRDGTTVEMAVAPRLVTGALLAIAPTPLEIEAGDTIVSIDPSGSTDGAARLDRRIGLGVGTYRGEVAVDTAGRRADVARYRRVEVAAPGALGPEGLPLRYEADDSWDRRFLGEALVIDAQIAPLLASLGPAERDAFLDPATLRDAMPGLPSGGALADRLDELDDGGAALVLAAIATAVDDRSFTTAWDRADDFQADGAPWGLAALDQGARSSEVLPTLRAALDTVDLQAPTATDDDDAVAAEGTDGGADPASTDATETPAAGGGAGSETDPGNGTTVPDPGGGGSGGPSDPGVPVPPVPGVPLPPSIPVPTTPNVPEVVDDVGGAVGGAVDGVTDGVDDVVPGAGGVIDGVVGGVGGVVGGVGGVVSGAGGAAGGAVGGIVGGLGGAVGGLGTGLSTALSG